MPFVEVPKGHIATEILQDLNVVKEARREINPLLIDEHAFARLIVRNIEAALFPPGKKSVRLFALPNRHEAQIENPTQQKNDFGLDVTWNWRQRMGCND